MGRSTSAYRSCCQAASTPWQTSSTLTNSVTCTSDLPYRATMNRKAGSVTPSMGESPMIGCGMSCQKLTGAMVAQRPTKIEGTSPRLVPSSCCWPGGYWVIRMFPLLSVPPSVGPPSTEMVNVSVVPGSPLSVTLTVKVHAVPLTVQVPPNVAMLPATTSEV